MRRRLTIWGSVLLSAVLLLANWAAVSSILDHLTAPVVFYARVARLYSKEPDQQLSMPVKGINTREVANTWQAPRGTDRKHQGQDIFAPRGTPVLSATNGYVMRIGENNLGGKTVSVIGNGGRVYYYAHLDSYAEQLAEGDAVTPQTTLGYVGTTGNAQGTPPHLHFGIYSVGGAINPLPLLVDRSSPAIEPLRQPRGRH